MDAHQEGLRAAGLSSSISAHSLRHGFADAADEAGVSVRDLAEMLRNDPAVALRYQHRKSQGRDREKLSATAAAVAGAIERGRVEGQWKGQ